MLTDPQTVTINAVAQSMPRINTSGTKSVYRSADQNFQLTISHQTTAKRARRMVRLDKRAVVADPLSGVNDYENLGIYLVIDEPLYGFADVDIDSVIDGFVAWFTASNIAKVLGDEH